MLTLNLVRKERKKKKKTVPPLDFTWATRVSLRLSAHLTLKLGVSDLNKQISSKKNNKKNFLCLSRELQG